MKLNKLWAKNHGGPLHPNLNLLDFVVGSALEEYASKTSNNNKTHPNTPALGARDPTNLGQYQGIPSPLGPYLVWLFYICVDLGYEMCFKWVCEQIFINTVHPNMCGLLSIRVLRH